MSFFNVFLSNASLNYYLDNILSTFSNFLHKQFNLNGHWEVALTETTYPIKFKKVIDGTFIFGMFETKKTKIQKSVIK